MKNLNLEENVKDRLKNYSLTELKSFLDAARHMTYCDDDIKWTRIYNAAEELLEEKMTNIVKGL
jgi:hypothetical protein